MKTCSNGMLCCWFTTLLTITILCLVGVVRKDSRRTTRRKESSAVVVMERAPLPRAFVRGKRRSSDIETLIEMLEVKCETMTNGFGDAIDIVTRALFEDIDPQRDAAVVTRLKRRVSTIQTCAERLNAKLQYERLLHTVAELYYESVRYRSSMYFLHISKSGGTCSSVSLTHSYIIAYTRNTKTTGTAMCDLACRNGCRTPHCGKDGNCWSRQAKDGPIWETTHTLSNNNEWWVDDESSSRNAMYSNCLLEERHLISKDWNFVANENYLFGGESTPKHVQVCSTQFLNVVVIRDPIQRVLSHMAHMRSLYKSKNQHIDDVSKFVNDFRVIASNYMSRILLGRKIFRELDDLDIRHNRTRAKEYLDLAKRYVSQFDIIIVMDDLFSNRAENVRDVREWVITLNSIIT